MYLSRVLYYDFLFNFFSDGGGRSGVYLALDANMELSEEEDSFDIFGYMKKLRQSRKGLIENVVSFTHNIYRSCYV